MSNAFGFTVDRLNSRALGVADWLANGTLELYNDSRPITSGGALTTQTLLATFLLPTALAVSNGVITGLLTGTTIAASGVPSWGRFKDASSVAIADADVGAVGSGAAIQVIESLALISGFSIICISFSLAEQ